MTHVTNVVTNTRMLSAGSQRMARHRKRRRDGLRCYTVQLRDREVEILIQLGLLSAAERADRRSVIKALHNFFDETLGQIR
jgi:hypothetical protein